MMHICINRFQGVKKKQPTLTPWVLQGSTTYIYINNNTNAFISAYAAKIMPNVLRCFNAIFIFYYK